MKSWSRTQTAIALSSAEAELYAMSKCAPTDGIFDKYRQVVHSDAPATLGIGYRRGLRDRTRHVKVQYMWIPDAVENKELEIGKMGLWRTLLIC